GKIEPLMLSRRRELGLSVIELCIHHGHRNPFPTRGGVARLACRLKRSPVWIFVAGSTRLERKTRPTRLLVFSGDVTFGALNLEVHSGQGIARLGVIKAVD